MSLQNTTPRGIESGFSGLAYLDNNFRGLAAEYNTDVDTHGYGLLTLLSVGTPGYNKNDAYKGVHQGGDGGNIELQLTSSQSSTFVMTDTVVSSSGAGSVTTPDASAIRVMSVGGDGGATEFGWAMRGGSGGTLDLDIDNTQVTFKPDGGSDQAVWAGITALSVGGAGGMCCVAQADRDGQAKYDDKPWAYLPTADMTGSYYSGINIDGGERGQMITKYGLNGNGGAVSVSLSDTAIQGTGSRLVGVSAASLGGAREVATNIPGSGRWQDEWDGGNSLNTKDIWYVNYYYDTVKMPYPGSAGKVDVTLSSTDVSLQGKNDLVGVYAVSASQPFYLLTNILEFSGSTPTAGAVKATVDASSSIRALGSIDPSDRGLSVGLLAMSTGGYSLNPLPMESKPVSTTHDMGVGGAVTVINRGTVQVSDETAIGIVALSSAGGQSTGGGGSQGMPTSKGPADEVKLSNYGSVVVTGRNAVGLIAGSVSSGGLAHQVDANDFSNGAPDHPKNRVI